MDTSGLSLEERRARMKKLEASTFCLPEDIETSFEELAKGAASSFPAAEATSNKELQESIVYNKAMQKIAQHMAEVLAAESQLTVGDVSVVMLYLAAALGMAARTGEGGYLYAVMLEKALQMTIQNSAINAVLDAAFQDKPKTH